MMQRWLLYRTNLLIVWTVVYLFLHPFCYGFVDPPRDLPKCANTLAIYQPRFKVPEEILKTGQTDLDRMGLKFKEVGGLLRIVDGHDSKIAELEPVALAPRRYRIDFYVKGREPDSKIDFRGKGFATLLMAKFLLSHPEVEVVDGYTVLDNQDALKNAFESIPLELQGTKLARAFALSQMPAYKIRASFGFVLDPAQTKFLFVTSGKIKKISANDEATLNSSEINDLVRGAVHLVMTRQP